MGDRGRRRCAVLACAVAAAILCAPAGGLPAAPRSAVSAPRVSDPRDVPDDDPLDIASARVAAGGAGLVIDLTTYGPWDPAQVDQAPGRSLCVLLAGATGPPRERLCVHGPAGYQQAALRLTRLAPDGTALGARRVQAVAVRRDERSLRLRVPLARLDLEGAVLRWSVRSQWHDDGLCAGPGCQDLAPDAGQATAALVAPARAGCVPRPPLERDRGPRRPAVALTFDDGPGADTPRVLAALERERAVATFFVVGGEVPGEGAVLRRELRDGDAIGNHTLTHADVSGAGARAEHELIATSRLVRAATGYAPCLFRAPYGRTSPALVALAGTLGMATVGWDVDPRDWSRPGTAAIERAVRDGAGPGSIVILHDGGGDRSQTVAALPQIVAALRLRGYRLVTVPDLLGFAAVAPLPPAGDTGGI